MGASPVVPSPSTPEQRAGGVRGRSWPVLAGIAAAVIAVGIAAWALLRTDDSGTPTAVSAEDVRQQEAAVRELVSRNDELERTLGSSISRPTGIGSDVYTEDAVWNDWGVRFVGRDNVLGFLQMWAFTAGSATYRDLGSYAGRTGGVSTEAVWGMSGWTKQSPSAWIAEWQHRDGKVASVVLLADLSTMKPGRFPPGVDDVSPTVQREISDLTSGYAEAWSSGDPAAIDRLYAPDAVREDMVFGDREEGRDEIGTLASHFSAWHPNAHFEVTKPYGVGKPAVPDRPVVAAELAIGTTAVDGSPCTVRAAVFLETKDGLIASERIYYDAESLERCGWAK